MIPQSTKKFIDSLIDYYISEAASYKQLAKTCSEEVDVTSVTFGVIVGCIYSGFLQVYLDQKQKPSLEDIQEFTNIIKSRSVKLKKTIAEAKI